MENNLPYIHGFSDEEQKRLKSQARFAEHTIYKNINFSNAKHILEVGSGVGAQTEILLRRFPEISVTGIDQSIRQLETAKISLEQEFFFEGRYEFLNMDATKMDFDSQSFDGAFLCWVLEHIPKPERVLGELRRVLKPGSKVYMTEVLNSALFLDPYSPNLWKFWMSFNDFQYDHGGDPFIGAKLGNMLLSTGFKDIEVSTITWHLDNRNPVRRKEYIDYWVDLVMSATDSLLDSKYVDQETVDNALKEIDEIQADPNAVIYDAFIQASARC